MFFQKEKKMSLTFTDPSLGLKTSCFQISSVVWQSSHGQEIKTSEMQDKNWIQPAETQDVPLLNAHHGE